MARSRQRHLRGDEDGPSVEPPEVPQDGEPEQDDDPFGALGAEMAEILRSAHAAAEAERARARADAEAIRGAAEADAEVIRSTAQADATAQITTATELREAAERTVQDAQEHAARIRAQLEAEQQRVTRELEAERARVADEVAGERSDARTAIENAIDVLGAALDRLDDTEPGDEPGDEPDHEMAEVTAEGEAAPVVPGDLPSAAPGTPSTGAGEPGTEGLSSAVRAAISMAFGPKTDTPT